MIKNSSFMKATQLLFDCIGEFQHAWVAGWNGDSYKGACMAMFTGNAAPGGSINEVECKEPVPVICQLEEPQWRPPHRA